MICAGHHPDGEVETTQHWCQNHQREIRNALQELPELYVQLHIEALYGTPRSTAARTSKTLDPSPAPRIDDADQLQRTVCSWATGTSLELENDSWPFTTISEATSYLLTRLHRVWKLPEQEPWPVMLGRDVLHNHHQLLKRTARDRLVHRLDAPCPTCDMRTLYRDNGADNVVCGNRRCNRTWTEAEYTRLVLILAAEVNA